MSSRFDDVFKARRGEEAGSEKSSAKRGSATKRSSSKKSKKGDPSAKNERANSGGDGSEGKTRRGRPNGKRSDPDYVGFTTYIRKDTHYEVKVALLQEKKGRELSMLVEELLAHWLKSRPKQ